MRLELVTAFRVAARRITANRRLMAAVTLGVVLAIALMASTAIYRDALRTLGLRTDLERVPSAELDVAVVTGSHLLTPEFVDSSQGALERWMRLLDPFVERRERSLSSSTFFVSAPGEPRPEGPDVRRAVFRFIDGFEGETELIAGRRAGVAAVTGDDPPRIDAAIGARAASLLGLGLGDQFALHEPLRGEGRDPLLVTVVGIVRPFDVADRFWGTAQDQFEVPQPDNLQPLSLFVPEETISGAVASYLPTSRGRLQTLLYVDPALFDADQSAADTDLIASVIRSLELAVETTTVDSLLVETLLAFNTKKFFSAVPLLVLTLQIVGIVLFYLLLISTMVVDRQAAEVALLKSRGAGLAQVMAVSVIEGLLLVGVGIALGPLLARELVALLGVTPAFSDITDGSRLTTALTGEAYLWAGAGGLLAFAALLWPAFRANRDSLVQQARRRSRPPGQPAFQRYYLDVVLVIVAALFFFQLQDSGSLVTEDLFGGLDQDPLLLAAPAVFVLTVSVLFLRLFPLLLQGVGWLVARMGGASVHMAFLHLQRAPLQPGRLALLLIMAASLGMFGGTFGATLDRSFGDRANYEAGAELRVLASDARGDGAARVERQVAALPGVEAFSVAQRVRADLPGASFDVRTVEVLGVDREQFDEVAWFRDDLADVPLEDLLVALQPPPLARLQLLMPADATAIGIWMWVPPDFSGGLSPFVRVRDPDDAIVRVRFDVDPPTAVAFEGEPGGDGWFFISAVLERPAGAPPDGGWEVLSLSVGTSGVRNFSGEFVWDELQYTSASEPRASRAARGFTDGVVLEGFEEQARWTVLTDVQAEALPDDARLSRANVIAGESALRYAWNRDVRSNQRGIRLVGPEEPMRALVSREFLETAGLFVGDTRSFTFPGASIPVTLVGTFDLFPTWDPRGRTHFMVVDRDHLEYRLTRNPGALPNFGNEASITPQGEEGRQMLLVALASGLIGRHELVDAEALRRLQEEDPLLAAGWEGLLFVTFLAVVLLAALGFLVASVIVAQQQAAEFAVLRTMGLSTRQILVVVGVEKLLVIVVSVLLGALVGLQLGVLMLDFVGFVETGEELLPPFVRVTDWATLGGALAVLLLAFAATIGIIVVLYMRLAIGQALRIGAD